MSHLRLTATLQARARQWLMPLAIVAAAACPQARAETADQYPSKPIRFIVPFTAGGLTDKLARALAHEMTESWKQPVVVENRGGAGGTIGADLAAKAPGDGYVVLMGTHATHAINVTLLEPLPYDAVKDFKPVTLLATVPSVLLVNPALPVNSVQDLVKLAKSRPGTLNYSSQGVGTSGHMAGEYFKMLAGIDMVHVPAKGPAQALADVMGNHVDMVFDSVAIGMPLVRSGKLKGLAVTSRERSPSAPDLPTMAEAGVPGYEIALWFALYTPKGTPDAIVAKLNQEMRRALAQPAIRDTFIQDGVTLAATTPVELAAFQSDEASKWGRLIKATGAGK